MHNFVIDECYFAEEDQKENSSNKGEKEKEGWECDEFNPFEKKESNLSEGSSSNATDNQSNQAPAFHGLREFRTSIDANDQIANGRPNTRNFEDTPRHRKFTLSFDETAKESYTIEGNDTKFDGSIPPAYKHCSFRHTETAIKEEEDASFELNIEDDYFNDDLSDFTPAIDGSIQDDEMLHMPTDANTGARMQISESRVANLNEKSSELDNSQFESILYSLQQVVSDSSMNKLNTSDEYSLFLNHVESIRKRLDSQATDVSGGSNISNKKSLNSINKSNDVKDCLLNNYMEIIELKDKLSGSPFDSIIN
jgi:hypothetical protein